MKSVKLTAGLLLAVTVVFVVLFSVLAQEPEERFTIPGSDLNFTQSQIDDQYNVVDWFPGEFPPAPDIVKYGDPDRGLWACGLCHLISGYGHPESAALNGLSEEYLYQQLKAFKNWHRADQSGAMVMFVMPWEDEALREAARYFASIPPGPVVRVEEVEYVPKTYTDDGWRTKIKDPEDPVEEPIGQRVVTLPESEFLRTARDPYGTFVSYVPLGSLQRGRIIANEGTETSQPCASCHGMDMKGTPLGPFIAGQFPDYLVRNLRAFKWATRRASGDEDGQMQEQVRYLSEDDVLAVSAYIGSLPRN